MAQVHRSGSAMPSKHQQTQAWLEILPSDSVARDLSAGSPNTEEDWERVKPIIEELYIHKSLALKDVDHIMRTSYDFRASQKMYKRRFVKWNWSKYRTRPDSSAALTTGGIRASRGPRGGKRVTTAVRRQILPKTLLEADSSQQITTIYQTFRGFIRGWTETDPRSQGPRPFNKTEGYNPAMISHFYLAVNHFKSNEHVLGGRALRCAFLELEDLIMDGHINAVWDCCVSIPGLTLSWGLKDVLMTYLRYLSRLTAAKAKNHPIATISRNLCAFAENNPDQIQQYTRKSLKLWTDSVTPIIGRDNVNVLNLKRAYWVTQKEFDMAEIQGMIVDYERLIKLGNETRETLGEKETTTFTFIEFDSLSVRLRFGMPGTDFEDRVEEVLKRLQNKYGDTPVEEWMPLESSAFRGCWHHLELASMMRGNLARAAAAREKFLECAADGDWIQYALRMEDRLNTAGMHDVAQQVKDVRLQVLLPANIVKVLEAEEKEGIENGSSPGTLSAGTGTVEGEEVGET